MIRIRGARNRLAAQVFLASSPLGTPFPTPQATHLFLSIFYISLSLLFSQVMSYFLPIFHLSQFGSKIPCQRPTVKSLALTLALCRNWGRGLVECYRLSGSHPGRGLWGAGLLLFLFHVPVIMWTIYPVILLPWYATQPLDKSNEPFRSWHETSKAVTQNKPFLIIRSGPHLCLVFCYSNGKLTNILSNKASVILSPNLMLPSPRNWVLPVYFQGSHIFILQFHSPKAMSTLRAGLVETLMTHWCSSLQTSHLLARPQILLFSFIAEFPYGLCFFISHHTSTPHNLTAWSHHSNKTALSNVILLNPQRTI